MKLTICPFEFELELEFELSYEQFESVNRVRELNEVKICAVCDKDSGYIVLLLNQLNHTKACL
jgi:hypothetical protein